MTRRTIAWRAGCGETRTSGSGGRPGETDPEQFGHRAPGRPHKDTGLTNLALHEMDQNRIWQAIVMLACEITTWTQLLAFTEHPARRWEPTRLRHRLLSLPAQLVRHARQTVLNLPANCRVRPAQSAWIHRPSLRNQ